ncbi:MAG TPA: hypothetical protein IGQ44_09290 [Geminocystis sp. M7585_C2015_104]|nr:hypothetical protein [Geminocystis sp. M7585_C2015_104]
MENRKEKILVVENEASIRRILETRLPMTSYGLFRGLRKKCYISIIMLTAPGYVAGRNI